MGTRRRRHAFLLVARAVKDRSFVPRVVSLGVRDNVVRLVFNPFLLAKIPVHTRAAIDSVERRLFDGTLKLVDSTGTIVSQ